MDIIIKNGTIVDENHSYRADIGILGEKIEIIGQDLNSDSARIIDAAGKLVMPGMIDAHTHLAHPVYGTLTADDFLTGSRAAAFGGITTFIDFAVQEEGKSLNDALVRRRDEASPVTCIDYSLHIILTDFRAETFSELGKMIEDGVPSFKLYLYHRNKKWIADGVLYRVLNEVSDGGLILVHAESNDIIKRKEDEHIINSETGMRYLGLSRQPVAEGAACTEAIYLAGQAESNLYITHVSTKEGLGAVINGKARGISVFCETCPQHLLLNDDKYREENAVLFAVSPPLRGDDDSRLLWSGIKEGVVDVISSNHCSFTKKQKNEHSEDFRRVPSGLPVIEISFPLMASESKNKNIDYSQIVRAMSYVPAKMFGLYPEKGSLMTGTDADIIIYDPDYESGISHENLHMNTDYSPFEGFKLKGSPIMTISRGRIIIENGEYKGTAGAGRFLRRTKFNASLIK